MRPHRIKQHCWHLNKNEDPKLKKTEASTDSKEESKQQVIFKMSKDDTSNSVLRAIKEDDSDDGLGEESVSPHLNTPHQTQKFQNERQQIDKIVLW